MSEIEEGEMYKWRGLSGVEGMEWKGKNRR